MKLWVTKKNQEWVSGMTGLPLDEVKRRYEKAREEKIICTIETNQENMQCDHDQNICFGHVPITENETWIPEQKFVGEK